MPCFDLQAVFKFIDTENLNYIERASIRAFLKQQGIGRFFDKDQTVDYIFNRLNKYSLHPKRIGYPCFSEVLTPHATELLANSPRLLGSARDGS